MEGIHGAGTRDACMPGAPQGWNPRRMHAWRGSQTLYQCGPLSQNETNAPGYHTINRGETVNCHLDWTR